MCSVWWCRKRYGQSSAGRPSLAGVASKFADYAVSVLDGSGHIAGGQQQQTPTTAQRPGRSALDALRWSAGATAGAGVRRAKRQKTDDESQMHLDFGQKNFYNTRCRVCEMYYCPGLASDEKLHADFHKRVTLGIIYRGFKNQHTVSTFPDASYIVCMRRNAPGTHLAKAEEVREMVERELGGFQGGRGDSSVIFLMVSSERRVVGFLLSERIRRAYRVVSATKCQTNTRSAPGNSCESVAACSECAGEEHVAAQKCAAPESEKVGVSQSSLVPIGTCHETAIAQERATSHAHVPINHQHHASAADVMAASATADAERQRGVAAVRAGVEECQESQATLDSNDTSTGAAEQARANANRPDAVVEASRGGTSECSFAHSAAPSVNDMTHAAAAVLEAASSSDRGAVAENSDDDDYDLDGIDLDALEAAASSCSVATFVGGGGEGAKVCTTSADETCHLSTGTPPCGVWCAVQDESQLVSLSATPLSAEIPVQLPRCTTSDDTESVGEKGRADKDASQHGAAGVLCTDSLRHLEAAPNIAATGMEEEGKEEKTEDCGAEVDDVCHESLMVSVEEEKAVCGVCLVWVHQTYRRKGAATRLLRAALEFSGYNDCDPVPPSLVAFSQVRVYMSGLNVFKYTP